MKHKPGSDLVIFCFFLMLPCSQWCAYHPSPMGVLGTKKIPMRTPSALSRGIAFFSCLGKRWIEWYYLFLDNIEMTTTYNGAVMDSSFCKKIDECAPHITNDCLGYGCSLEPEHCTGYILLCPNLSHQHQSDIDVSIA